MDVVRVHKFTEARKRAHDAVRQAASQVDDARASLPSLDVRITSLLAAEVENLQSINEAIREVTQEDIIALNA